MRHSLIISLFVAFSCPLLLLPSLPGLSSTSISVFLKSWFCIYEIFVSMSLTSHDTLLLSQQSHLLSNGCHIFIFSAVGSLTPFTLSYPGPRLLVLMHDISTYFIFFYPTQSIESYRVSAIIFWMPALPFLQASPLGHHTRDHPSSSLLLSDWLL